MTKKTRKINKKWIEQNRLLYREFLDETNFPDTECSGERGPKFQYPGWLIKFIAILSVKLKVKSYVQIHRTVMQYWNQIVAGLDLKIISEQPLPDLLKKLLSPSKASSVYFSVIS
jgi:hypothetical protein